MTKKNDYNNFKKAVYEYDLPIDLVNNFKGTMIAIDTEAMGLSIFRDRLCLIQILMDNMVHMVHFPTSNYESPNLKKLLNNNKIQKIFHFARFDLNMIYVYLKISLNNIVCTRTLSKISRTYSDKHGLKELCRELLGKDLNKGEQSSDWGRDKLSDSQISYAANDVIYLPEIFEVLKKMCVRENRYTVAEIMFEFLPKAIIVESMQFDAALLIDF